MSLRDKAIELMGSSELLVTDYSINRAGRGKVMEIS